MRRMVLKIVLLLIVAIFIICFRFQVDALTIYLFIIFPYFPPVYLLMFKAYLTTLAYI